MSDPLTHFKRQVMLKSLTGLARVQYAELVLLDDKGAQRIIQDALAHNEDDFELFPEFDDLNQ